MIFAMSSQFAGAVAVSEALMYFTYFCKKEWGPDFYERWDEVVGRSYDGKEKTILSEIHQYWQQIIYTINQPAAARGFQSAFVNFSYFDKYFFEGMFGDFYFPDGTQPDWESLKYVQMEFMKWFNNERLRTVLTFPVESFTLLYKDGQFLDQEMFQFVCDEYARGHSFFTYISDTVDSLSSCCRLKNKIQVKEFNFTNGNIGVQTGSKSVITLNLSRIIQNCDRSYGLKRNGGWRENTSFLKSYITEILERVYKYHTAYNELLWDMYEADLLPVYKAGFIDLNKQYLTIGLNGLNQAAEYLGMTCNDNEEYSKFCQFIFSTIKDLNTVHSGKFNDHKLTFNTEQIPAESLAAKNYNWDKEDGYWVPDDTNLYASYIFKPNDPSTTVLEKIRMHGRDYIGDYLDGGSACHINLDSHLSTEQYKHLLTYAARVGCSYITFNIPMTECKDCGHIVNAPVDVCPHCGSKRLKFYTRIIGYLTAVTNWANPRKVEFEDRVFAHIDAGCDDNINGGGYIGYNKYKAK
jgi:ribonucleoside-triphosphate reductase